MIITAMAVGIVCVRMHACARTCVVVGVFLFVVRAFHTVQVRGTVTHWTVHDLRGAFTIHIFPVQCPETIGHLPRSTLSLFSHPCGKFKPIG